VQTGHLSVPKNLQMRRSAYWAPRLSSTFSTGHTRTFQRTCLLREYCVRTREWFHRFPTASRSEDPETHVETSAHSQRVAFWDRVERIAETTRLHPPHFSKLSWTCRHIEFQLKHPERSNNGRQSTSKPNLALSEPHFRGFLPLRRFPTQEATNVEFTSLDCATPSGFLNLLTSFSACVFSALFHAESVHGVEALRGFPLPVAATAFAALCPSSCSFYPPGKIFALLRRATR